MKKYKPKFKLEVVKSVLSGEDGAKLLARKSPRIPVCLGGRQVFMKGIKYRDVTSIAQSRRSQHLQLSGVAVKKQ